MNDELPPIPDDPQQSFGSEMQNLERAFSSKAGKHRGGATWQLVHPNNHVGPEHAENSVEEAILAASTVLAETGCNVDIATKGAAFAIRALPFREHQSIALVMPVAGNPETPPGPTGPVGPVGQVGPCP